MPGNRVDGNRGGGERLVSRLHHAGFELIRRQTGILLQQQNSGTTDNRGCHAGPAQNEVVRQVVEVTDHAVCRVCNIQRAAMIDNGFHQVARSQDVGLHHVIVAGGTLRAVAGDAVVGAGGGSHALHGSDRDHIGVVAWRGDGSVAVAAVHAQAAIIAGGHYHDDARSPRRFHGLAQRVVGVVIPDGTPERQIDYANVVRAFQRDSPLDPGDHVAVATAAILVKYA